MMSSTPIRSLQILLLLVNMLFVSGTEGLTVCSPSCPSTTPGADGEIGTQITGGSVQIVPGTPLALINTINVDGNLYLDYSLFTDSEQLSINGDTSITAQSVYVYSYDTTSLPTTRLQQFSISTEPLFFSDSGDWLFYSLAPLSNLIVNATGAISVGNYAPLSQIPLPAPLLLFSSALFAIKAFSCHRK